MRPQEKAFFRGGQTLAGAAGKGKSGTKVAPRKR